MKIAVACNSLLLQKSLETFLSKYLSSQKKSDIVIRDEECFNDKRCFYISSDRKADLLKPFSKAQLILALEKKYNELYLKTESVTEIQEDRDIFHENKGKVDFEVLQKRIEYLTKEYQENILRTVKAFYEE